MACSNASNRCTVLVTSCDRYRDIEAPFLALWRRHWPRLKSNLKKAVFAVFPWELVVRVQNVFNLGRK